MIYEIVKWRSLVADFWASWHALHASWIESCLKLMEFGYRFSLLACLVSTAYHVSMNWRPYTCESFLTESLSPQPWLWQAAFGPESHSSLVSAVFDRALLCNVHKLRYYVELSAGCHTWSLVPCHWFKNSLFNNSGAKCQIDCEIPGVRIRKGN